MRQTIIAALILITIVVAAATGPLALVSRSTADLPMSEVMNREIIVELDVSRGVKSASAFCESSDLLYRRPLPVSYASYEVIAVPEGRDYHAVLAELEADPRIKTVGPNVRKHVSTTFLNDPLLLSGATDLFQGLGAPYARNDQWGALISGCADAWDTTTGDSHVVVAVLDTGVNFSHEDLQNRFWTNTAEAGGSAGVDDDSNGFIDDVNGYDFAHFSSTGGDSDPSDPTSDFISHGNATSSIVAARGDNSRGIAGVAGGNTASNGARIMALRVGTNSDIGVDAEIAAIDYAIENGAKVISMSFGGVTGGPPEKDAIDRAWDAGLYVVAAGGNSGQGNRPGGVDAIDLPAGFENCVAVGATTIFPTQTVTGSSEIIPEEHASTYSKTGPEVEIAAPGTHILAAALADDGYTSLAHQFTGTSAATPLVAGLAALLWSADYMLNGHFTLSNSDVRDILNQTAVDMGTAGRDEETGFGRIDMAAAIAFVLPGLSGDTNSDGVVDADDVQPIILHFGKTSSDAGYDEQIDANGDGVIDELDLFVVGRNFGSTG